MAPSWQEHFFEKLVTASHGEGDAAIRENTVKLGIKESLSQRDIEADIQTG